MILFLFASGILFYTLSATELKTLHTKGNKIIQDDKPIILKGAVSDYFRYDYGYRQENMVNEFENLITLHKAGANIIGLYLSDYPKIKKNVEQLDKYINYANRNDMYVYLAPVGHNFRETQNSTNKNNYTINPDDVTHLTQLTQFLVERYKDRSGILYQPAAEADIGADDWVKKQKDLIKIIRKYNKNPIIVSTTNYSPYESLPFSKDENLIYQTGGYTRDTDTDNSSNRMTISEIVDKRNNLSLNYPVLVGEFGGNTQKDFSSSKDLETLQEIFEEIKKKNVNFTAYRIGPNFENDSLSIFDTKGNITKRGMIVFKYLGI